MRWLWRVLVAMIVLSACAIVFLRVPDIDHETLTARYATPPSKFILLADGTRVHLRDQGNHDGPPMVLLHGSNSSLFTWEGWIAPLGDAYRIVTVDLPGHGLTGRTVADDYSSDGMSSFVTAFLDALNLDRVVLGGNSMGGGIAARYAVDHPSRVEALVLVDAAGLPRPQNARTPIGMTLFRLPVANHVVELITPRALVDQALKTAYANPNLVTEEMVNRFYALLLHTGNRRATRLRFSEPYDESLKANLGRIEAATLVLWGTEDALIPLVNAVRFTDGIPKSVAVTLEGIGHVPQEEAPRKSAIIVRQFLDQLDR